MCKEKWEWREEATSKLSDSPSLSEDSASSIFPSSSLASTSVVFIQSPFARTSPTLSSPSESVVDRLLSICTISAPTSFLHKFQFRSQNLYQFKSETTPIILRIVFCNFPTNPTNQKIKNRHNKSVYNRKREIWAEQTMGSHHADEYPANICG